MQQFFFSGLLIFTLIFSCTKTAYVSLETDTLTPVINQKVNFKLNSGRAESYTVLIEDELIWLVESDTFSYTWEEAGTYNVVVNAHPKHGKKDGHHCMLITVYNDPAIFDGSYFLEGTCESYTVDVSVLGLEHIQINNFGDLDFEITASTYAYQGYGFFINKQIKTTATGKYSISGEGYLTTSNDRLVIEYIIEYEDFFNSDLNYTEFCKMDGLKL